LQGDAETDNRSANNAETIPMMSSEPITVPPGRVSDDDQPIRGQEGGASDASQPIILQPRSSADSPSEHTANDDVSQALV